jgi:transposase InsO family protein
MIPEEQKKHIVQYIQDAVEDGARVKEACACIELSYRSFLRWKAGKTHDGRKGAVKSVPRKLSSAEEQAFFDVANTQEFRDKTPGQIVASLLEKGIYHGSERTLYRILKKREALGHRQKRRAPTKSKKPQELIATDPNQVWNWDITWLPTRVKGIFLFAYVIIDIFSRKIVGWSVEIEESPELAAALFRRTINGQKAKPVFVHADNGGPMKGLSLVALLTMLQVNMTYNRPRVSNDNPFIESFFGSMKGHVKYPKCFEDVEHARIWFAEFVDWYNNQHLHSGIGYVTPAQRHSGQDLDILSERQKTLNKAYEMFPERFVKGTRELLGNRAVILHKKVS